MRGPCRHDTAAPPGRINLSPGRILSEKTSMQTVKCWDLNNQFHDMSMPDQRSLWKLG
ncbi:protein of unknown function [Rhodovastum atsumiense]|nr:protein of unknown function [Rhodovastum atsumiense]